MYLPIQVVHLSRFESPFQACPWLERNHREIQKLQKHVVLPSAPQTKPILGEDEDVFGYETDAGIRMRDYKSQADRMRK
ncbi:hypothetical protein DFJ43DRAFT_996193 [Lentinula guzmanii]|uniref:Uncharacterized protein n=1 Tax=Lentinula guzmanii TaxID=2804957 RepID=A0AA38JBA8_9AGAR|nr:hypothetical protein DFJ43DRAFT_996193 [Lentinula guzmanii]